MTVKEIFEKSMFETNKQTIEIIKIDENGNRTLYKNQNTVLENEIKNILITSIGNIYIFI